MCQRHVYVPSRFELKVHDNYYIIIMYICNLYDICTMDRCVTEQNGQIFYRIRKDHISVQVTEIWPFLMYF